MSLKNKIILPLLILSTYSCIGMNKMQQLTVASSNNHESLTRNNCSSTNNSDNPPQAKTYEEKIKELTQEVLNIINDKSKEEIAALLTESNKFYTINETPPIQQLKILTKQVPNSINHNFPEKQTKLLIQPNKWNVIETNLTKKTHKQLSGNEIIVKPSITNTYQTSNIKKIS